MNKLSDLPAALAALRAAALRHFDGVPLTQRDVRTAIPWLSFIRLAAPTPTQCAMLEPSMCLLLQGEKRTLVGQEVLAYGPGSYVLSGVELPVAGQVTAATAAAPYLGIRVGLDTKELAAFLLEMRPPVPPAAEGRSAVYVEQADDALLDVFGRLLRLLESPRDVPVLARILKQELTYRLLTAPSGGVLAQTVLGGTDEQPVGRAIRWIREHYDEPLSIDALAREVRLSTSVLHRRFKQVTVMSPLQYQKQVRLLEARKLLLTSGLEAATVAYRVGYESPSQFSREYRRQFGAPPLRDAALLRDQMPEV
ncbi:AraC-like DNA-binding protein [Pseudoduganella flava]|uniref:AraC-like DNA-binding protein n=1 Tax=Pseudoduganella flava TaxID=871742 RepID=A0A562PJT5_9BURK|nr:AraC family transcriptional regulator [Pseudoduganella flava]QGZ41872.1 helix-turn-helix domain-containing protein [Pseudoduganella flava]TWI44276.1 AraC-like DNA-binding protein [Pseudoduganella flava]